MSTSDGGAAPAATLAKLARGVGVVQREAAAAAALAKVDKAVVFTSMFKHFQLLVDSYTPCTAQTLAVDFDAWFGLVELLGPVDDAVLLRLRNHLVRIRIDTVPVLCNCMARACKNLTAMLAASRQRREMAAHCDRIVAALEAARAPAHGSASGSAASAAPHGSAAVGGAGTA